ncbi:hypothetical protein ACSBR1_036912 [Camellia fascicularis]
MPKHSNMTPQIEHWYTHREVERGKFDSESHECYLFKSAHIGNEANWSEEIVLDVDLVNVWIRHGADIGMTDVDDVEPSFDW